MNEKYKQLFDYYTKLYNDEIERFRNLDNKIAKYFAAYSVIIALVGFIGLNLRSAFRSAELTTLFVIIYILLFLVLIFLAVSWMILLNALKIESLQRLEYKSSLIDFFDNNELIDIHYALSKRMREAIEYNVELGNKKSTKLMWAYRLSYPAIFLFIFSIALATCTLKDSKVNSIASTPKSTIDYKTNKANESTSYITQQPIKENIMGNEQDQKRPHNNEQSRPSSQPSQERPNPDVAAPDNVLITEGADPPKNKK